MRAIWCHVTADSRRQAEESSDPDRIAAAEAALDKAMDVMLGADDLGVGDLCDTGEEGGHSDDDDDGDGGGGGGGSGAGGVELAAAHDEDEDDGHWSVDADGCSTDRRKRRRGNDTAAADNADNGSAETRQEELGAAERALEAAEVAGDAGQIAAAEAQLEKAMDAMLGPGDGRLAGSDDDDDDDSDDGVDSDGGVGGSRTVSAMPRPSLPPVTLSPPSDCQRYHAASGGCTRGSHDALVPPAPAPRHPRPCIPPALPSNAHHTHLKGRRGTNGSHDALSTPAPAPALPTAPCPYHPTTSLARTQRSLARCPPHRPKGLAAADAGLDNFHAEALQKTRWDCAAIQVCLVRGRLRNPLLEFLN